jgi:hypothetical protein
MARRLTLVAVTTAVLAVSPTAYAGSGSPPVTVPDRLTMHAGEGALVDATANDSDPDGDSLQVCRLDPSVPRKLSQSFIDGGDLVVVANRRARGTYTLVYYACDSSYLTPGTVTVTVTPPAPTLDLIPIGDAPPGRMKIKNTYKHRTFRCEWRAMGSDEVEGKVTVRPRSSAVIVVKEEDFELDCSSGGVGYSFSFATGRHGGGHVVRLL